MSKPVSFQRNSFANVAEATTHKVFVASNYGFGAAVAVGGAAAMAAVFSRGRWVPSARQYTYWTRVMTGTGGTMVASGAANVFAQEAMFNKPGSKSEKAFTSPRRY
jgi:hypothetical protein